MRAGCIHSGLGGKGGGVRDVRPSEPSTQSLRCSESESVPLPQEPAQTLLPRERVRLFRIRLKMFLVPLPRRIADAAIAPGVGARGRAAIDAQDG